MTSNKISLLLLCTSLAAAACETGVPPSGGGGSGEVVAGALDVSVTGAAGVTGFQIDVATTAGMIVASQFLAATPSPSGSPKGFASFVLGAAEYVVTSTAMKGPGMPAPDCTPASVHVTVMRGKTAEVTLTARCQAARGIIAVTTTVDFAPVITAVSISPSTTVQPCERLTLTVDAVDPEGAPVTYAFAVTSGPPGDFFTLDVAGNRATFSGSVNGEFTVQIRACDAGGCSSLDVPVHVTGGTGGSCALTCDDGNPCTTDTRNMNGSCSHATVADGTLCSGGNLRVQLLGFNDFHGQIETGRLVAGRPVGGAAVLSSYLKAAQAGIEDQTIIVHAGDHVGASPPASALLQDEPSIQFLNVLANGSCSYTDKLNPACNVVGTLGNHEFDEGSGELFRLLNGGNFPSGPFLEDPYRGARFPYVNSNVVNEISGDNILPPYVIKNVKGIPIGIIGAVLKGTPTIVTPTGVAGLRFLDEADAINAQVPALKSLGVRTLVVTIHQGGTGTNYIGPTTPTAVIAGPEITDIVNRLDDEIDVVISGHTHSFSNAFLPNAHGKQILVVQAFANSTAYDDVDLLVNPVTHDVVSKTAQVVTTFGDAGPGLTPDPAVIPIVSAASARVAPLVNQVFGDATAAFTTTQNAAGESTMGDLIADAQRAAMSTQFAFMNPGGIRANLDAGPITFNDLFTIQPFGNTLVRMNLTGQQIYDVLEQQWLGQPFPRIMQISGFDYTWNPALPVGGRVTEVRLGGVAIDRTATYIVMCNNFMATGGDNFTVFRSGTNQIGGPVDLDALIDYVEANTPVTPAVLGSRIKNP